MTDRPYDLECYIAERRRSESAAKNADFKAISQATLDEISRQCDVEYERGQKLISSISEDDLRRCRNLYALRHDQYGADTLTQKYIEGQYVLVPCYAGFIEEVRSLCEALK